MRSSTANSYFLLNLILPHYYFLTDHVPTALPIGTGLIITLRIFLPELLLLFLTELVLTVLICLTKLVFTVLIFQGHTDAESLGWIDAIKEAIEDQKRCDWLIYIVFSISSSNYFFSKRIIGLYYKSYYFIIKRIIDLYYLFLSLFINLVIYVRLIAFIKILIYQIIS
jgi:hypothetical protein